MFSSEKCALLVVDVQGKLASLMAEKEILFKNIRILIQAARLLGIPVLWTEQAPQKLGATIPAVASLLPGYTPLSKISFSCCGEKEFLDGLTRLRRREIIMTGIEAHVCVYQTAAHLLEARYEVQVVSDAVSSRAGEDKQIGLDRIKSLGGIITSTEMILFELLKTAAHKQFKAVASLIK